MTPSIRRRGTIAYRQVTVSTGHGEDLRLPLAAPINDLLALDRGTEYFTYIHNRYGDAFAGARGYTGHSLDAPRAFRHAADLAAKGRIAAAVAEHLEHVEFAGDGSVAHIPDLPSLAAWCLVELVRRTPLVLKTCPTCKTPWIDTKGGSRYCERPAPGQSRDCRTLAKEKRLAGDSEYRAYRREYKRLHEAFQRGSITAEDVVGWRRDNGPKHWQPFDVWKTEQKEGNDG